MDADQTIINKEQKKQGNDDDEPLNELAKLLKVKFIFNQAKYLANSKKSPFLHGEKKITRVLKYLSIQEYLQLGSDTLLNLPNKVDVTLNFQQKSKLNQELENTIRNHLSPISTFKTRIQDEFPELLAEGDDSKTQDNENYTWMKSYRDILELEDQRRDLYPQLVELKNRKCILMKEIIETLKFNPNRSLEFELLELKTDLLAVKADLLRKHVIKELTTEKNFKALQALEPFVDEELKQIEGGGNANE